MRDPRLSGGVLCGVRQWSFADCLFDESNWTLTVGGRRVAVESKPLEILRQLLLHPGQVVSKAELLDSIWPDVAVVEASLPTAVRKLRVALGDENRAVPIIETVPRIGYRLAVPVDLLGEPPAETATGPAPAPVPAASTARWWPHVTAIAAAAALALFMIPTPAPSEDLAKPSNVQVMSAIRALDIPRVQAFVDAGWNSEVILDRSGSRPITVLAEVCEWHPGHDRQRMLILGRMLFDSGTDLTTRNVFGDTAYSIAKAPRYCGPDHPLTVMLRNMCYRGPNAAKLGDRCLASYELERRAAGKARAAR